MVIDQQWARRVAGALDMLGEVFEIALTQTRIEAYIESLSDLRAEALEGGARMIRDTQKRFPKPVEWREAAEKWEREEAERQQIAWERSRPFALPGPEGRLCTHEENMTNVRAIIEQMRYVVNHKPLEDRPHNRQAAGRAVLPPAPATAALMAHEDD
jgi:hypothetical protein